MPINTLGKVLFPRRQRWERERNVKQLLVALLVAVIVSAITVAMMFMRNSRPN